MDEKAKNSSLSVLLIVVNFILLIIFLNCTFNSENDQLANQVIAAVGLTILTGGYAFSYHGKGYRAGKWIFAIVLLLSTYVIAVFIYMLGLGAAFQH
ncbi:hypothetical protein [Pedobacter metabolipauper]|uniref:Uncharacterized protein n=1 Tax=Pedobacter metabolipauper TaxID=425513 RepID=A0A4R6SX47_9SPHI|nr:hypothetical protein [Pedobacter metabolipauper]TDQ10009.1 hypothetical protein ATK78_2168 [Pedobacter metabolipauper]